MSFQQPFRFSALLLFLAGSLQALGADSAPDPFANPPSPAFPGQTAAPAAPETSVEMEVLLDDLQISRAIETLPDGSLLVAEGTGRIRILSPGGSVSAPLQNMPPLRSGNGRILMDVALDARFAENRRLFLTYQAEPATAGGEPVEQVASALLSSDRSRLENVRILGDLPGRRLASTPDGKLFITTLGYMELRPLVQDLTSLNGKVLRINADGSIPADNPYIGIPNVRPEIYAIGHRDQDGIYFNRDSGELWTIEHGPMGGDELNIIRPGQNAGWPYVSYGKNYDGTEIGPSQWQGIAQPLYYWFPSLAPSGLIRVQSDRFPGWQGNLLIGSLSPSQGRFLIRLVMNGERVMAEEHLLVDYDRRVRDVSEAPDGTVYLLIDAENNPDAGRVFPGQVIRLRPN